MTIHRSPCMSCITINTLPVLSTGTPITGQGLKFDFPSQAFITISISLCNLNTTSFCLCKSSVPTPQHLYLLTTTWVPKYLAKKILAWPPCVISLTILSSDGCMSHTKRVCSSSFTVLARAAIGLGFLCGRSSIQRCSGVLPEYNSATSEGISTSDDSVLCDVVVEIERTIALGTVSTWTKPIIYFKNSEINFLL